MRKASTADAPSARTHRIPDNAISSMAALFSGPHDQDPAQTAIHALGDMPVLSSIHQETCKNLQTRFGSLLHSTEQIDIHSMHRQEMFQAYSVGLQLLPAPDHVNHRARIRKNS
jgi:hypothetical protein